MGKKQKLWKYDLPENLFFPKFRKVFYIFQYVKGVKKKMPLLVYYGILGGVILFLMPLKYVRLQFLNILCYSFVLKVDFPTKINKSLINRKVMKS